MSGERDFAQPWTVNPGGRGEEKNVTAQYANHAKNNKRCAGTSFRLFGVFRGCLSGVVAAGHLGTPGARSCRTNPISESASAGRIPSLPLFYRSTIPVRCQSCKTNPISSRRRRPDGGDYAEQSQTWGDWGIWAKRLSCGAWLGRGVKRAKRTQFGPAGSGCWGRNAQNKAKLGGTGTFRQRPSYGPWLGRGVERAKRTQ
jgi:hypothetical protein